jgi:hypothetical protein
MSSNMLALVYPVIFVPGCIQYLLLFPRFIEMILLFAEIRVD